jgi:hypothetical protein
MKQTETVTMPTATQLGDHVLIDIGGGLKLYKADSNELIAALTADRDIPTEKMSQSTDEK